MLALGHGIHYSAETQTQLLADKIYRYTYCCEHEECLKAVCPYDGTYAATKCVEPDQQDGDHYSGFKGDVPLVEKGDLQHVGNQEKPEGCSDGPGKQEKGRSRFIGALSEALLQVRIDRGQVQPVIH